MRSRLAILTLGLFLSFVVLACSKKPDQTTDTSTANPAPAATAPAQTPPVQPPPPPMRAAPKPEPIIVPAGTTLTVRLAQAVGSKISQTGETFSGTVASAIV